MSRGSHPTPCMKIVQNRPLPYIEAMCRAGKAMVHVANVVKQELFTLCDVS